MNYLNKSKPQQREVFYRWNNGAALTRSNFNAVIQRIFGPDYTSHSFRIGGATAAAEAGVAPNIIQKLGRWKSDCFRIYIRPSQEVLVDALKSLGLRSSLRFVGACE